MHGTGQKLLAGPKRVQHLLIPRSSFPFAVRED